MAKKKAAIKAPKKVPVKKPSEGEFRQLSRLSEDTRRHVFGMPPTTVMPASQILSRRVRGLLVNIFLDTAVADAPNSYLAELLCKIYELKHSDPHMAELISTVKERVDNALTSNS